MSAEIVEVQTPWEHLRTFVSLDSAVANAHNGWEPTDERFEMKAEVKWDGCVHLFRRWSLDGLEGEGTDDYMHICDLDEFIAWLQEIRRRVSGWKEWE